MIGFFKPTTIYAAGIALVVGFGAGWSVRDWKADADALKAMQKADEIRQEMQDRMDKQAIAFEKERNDIDSSRITTTNSIKEVYRDVKVPADCAVPEPAVRVLDNARRAANAYASGEPEGLLSEPPPAAKPAD